MNNELRPALKVEVAGEVTSFRYALYSHGFQPTYEMPPPSTIYGHICSALGRYLTDAELQSVQFGYHFVHSGRFVDYMEHLHFDDPVQPFPFNRELLFRPRLTLYIVGLDLYDVFVSPKYMVVLGRSQDLMTYRAVERIELRKANSAYFDHTLLPVWMAPRLSRNVTVATMARYIDPRRRPQWGSYALLHDTAVWPPPPRETDWMDEAETPLGFEGDEQQIELWIDPSTQYHRYPGLSRAIWLHKFVE